jgi:WD40 repeat protein
VIERTHIFISYAHQDAGELAARLRKDLRALGFDAWFDRQRLKAGDAWAKSIEKAIDSCDVAVALLSSGSYDSDICRAEQQRSLQKGKLVIPVRVQLDCDVPLPLQTRQYIDFADEANYASSFEQLASSIRERRGVIAPAESLQPHNNAPALPEKYVPRPQLVEALRDALFLEGPKRNLALTAVAGMGGIGKTVLAQALCHDEVVRQAYADGIFWFGIGRESNLRFDERLESVPGLKRLLGAYRGEEACISQYRDALRNKAVLIVLDDVWRTTDVEIFRTGSPRSRLLFTTRDSAIAAAVGAREQRAELLDEKQSRALLSAWAARGTESLFDSANDIISECGSLPLALAIVGALLRGKTAEEWRDILELLRNADIRAIEEQLPPGQSSFFRGIQVSFEALTPKMQEMYKALAVLLEELPAPIPMLQMLWNVKSASETRRIARRFAERSLAEIDATGAIQLHDLQLDYVRAAYGDPETLAVIHSAIRLSSHVVAQDPSQYASQLTARLFSLGGVGTVRRFTERITTAAPRPWIRALVPVLQAPRSSLIRTLAGHQQPVNDVALSADGRRVVSVSDDKTLRLWDLTTGREIRVMHHSDRLASVAISLDGRWALSGSEKGAITFWNLDTGTATFDFPRLRFEVTELAMHPDGRRVLAASGEIIAVCDLQTQYIARELYREYIWPISLALTRDGKSVVACSDRFLVLWQIETGRSVFYNCSTHTEDITAVAISSSGRIVTGSFDSRLKVWDMKTGEGAKNSDGSCESG